MSLKAQRDRLRKRRNKIDATLKELDGDRRRLKERIEAKASRDPKDDERADQLADELESLRAARSHVTERMDDLAARDGNLVAKIKVLGRKIRRRKKRKGAYASKNVRYDEFNCKQGGPVPEYMYPHLRKLCEEFIEPMRAKFGPVFITSGHRWSWYDAAIGGVGGYHVYEKYRHSPAADCIFERGTPAQWAAYARELADKLGKGGIGQYDRSGFVHMDPGPRRNWWG